MLFNSVTEYEAEIQATRKAIRRQLLIGAQHRHDAGNNSRSTTEVELTSLHNYLARLQREKAIMAGEQTGMIRVTGGI